MRICLVAESYSPARGGVEVSLQKLAEGFVAAGHEVRVVASSWERPSTKTEAHAGVTISRVYTPPFLKRFWFQFLSLPHIRRAARWADIVQGSTFAGGPPAFVVGWLSRKPKALIVHEVMGDRWFQFERSLLRALFYRVTEWIMIRLPFDHYIAPSMHTRDMLRGMGVGEEKLTVIYHGDSQLKNPTSSPDEVRRQLGFQKHDFVFMAFGRVGITKGFEYLADAIPDILHAIPSARFVLVLSRYDTRISRHIENVIETLPPRVCKLLQPLSRELLSAHLSAADCIVIPSLSEGFGFSALEACHANKVVVSTDAGSLPEVVFGKHVFVKAGSAAEIARGCLKAFRGEVEVTPEKHFSWDKAVGEYLRMYEHILRDRYPSTRTNTSS